MDSNAAPVTLATHLALLSCISFGGIPVVFPDIFHLVVANHWLSDRELTDFYAVSQAVPGPNMILLMGFIGWKVGGLPGAISSALAIFAPPCVMYFVAYRLWDRFRDKPWQLIVRRGLAPLTFGLIIAGGMVMARAADVGWRGIALTIAAMVLTTATRVSPLWVIAAGGAVGGFGLL
jgi:chromate transporter